MRDDPREISYIDGAGTKQSFVYYPSLRLIIPLDARKRFADEMASILTTNPNMTYDGKFLVLPQDDHELVQNIVNRYKATIVNRDLGDRFATAAINNQITGDVVRIGSQAQTKVLEDGGSINDMLELAKKDPEEACRMWRQIQDIKLDEEPLRMIWVEETSDDRGAPIYSAYYLPARNVTPFVQHARSIEQLRPILLSYLDRMNSYQGE